MLPGGKVFVFSGIIPIARTEDGLAAVLGHEIAHNLAGHVGERMSGQIGINILLGSVMLLTALVSKPSELFIYHFWSHSTTYMAKYATGRSEQIS